MIHAHVTPQTLGFIRIWVFGLWLLVIAPDPFHQLGVLPISIFEPYGVMRLIPSAAWPWIMHAQFLYSFKFILLILLVLAMLGVGPYRSIALAAAVMLTFHQGLVRGFGFINHKELGILYAVYILALFPAADGFTVQKQKTNLVPSATYSAALLLMTMIILLPYTAISAFRITRASPEIFLGESMKYYIAATSVQSNYYGRSISIWLLERPDLNFIINIGFIVITVFEVLSPLCLIYRYFRYAWLVVMIPFHISTSVLMNIFFWQNLFLFPVLLFDINRLISPNLPKDGLRALLSGRRDVENGDRAGHAGAGEPRAM